VLASFFPSAIEKMDVLSVVAQRALPMLTLLMPPLKVVGSLGVGWADEVCWKMGMAFCVMTSVVFKRSLLMSVSTEGRSSFPLVAMVSRRLIRASLLSC